MYVSGSGALLCNCWRHLDGMFQTGAICAMPRRSSWCMHTYTYIHTYMQYIDRCIHTYIHTHLLSFLAAAAMVVSSTLLADIAGRHKPFSESQFTRGYILAVILITTREYDSYIHTDIHTDIQTFQSCIQRIYSYCLIIYLRTFVRTYLRAYSKITYIYALKFHTVYVCIHTHTYIRTYTRCSVFIVCVVRYSRWVAVCCTEMYPAQAIGCARSGRSG